MPEYLIFLVRRVCQAILIVVGIVVVNFVVLNLAPGDMADVMAGLDGGGDAGFADQLRRQYGLDQPLLMQFVSYVRNLLTFDLGYSFTRHMPVLDAVMERLPATLLLMGVAIGIAFVVGALLGMIAGSHAGKPLDTVISLLALLGYATPLFWLGLLLILLFTIHLGWLPSGGMKTIGMRGDIYAQWLDVAKHLVLPALTLAVFYLAIFARLMRSSVIEAMGQDYVRTARSKGMSEIGVFLNHVGANAILPVLTMLGLQIGGMLGGSVVVETIFSWPGLGRLTYDAIFSRDLTLLLGILFLSSVCVVMTNLLVDLLYNWIDPRIGLK
ncbi:MULTISPECIES: ABC transporter permease [unclassified Brenneria]|uniref:ABC transporter permease n=1 Tax=unclassified Brenneria TaxID=2634434 RepID=UPI0029C4CFE7|nr:MULTISPECIES: ABC transporter permease [unclassified Brenneria]MDX5627462.1 ABC transporter permease [Brenneria sp. L3-3Z]MDX5694382.1 ABC transporter permease [Brenneria sp. L4-2C]